jgi:hypothetical protein
MLLELRGEGDLILLIGVLIMVGRGDQDFRFPQKPTEQKFVVDVHMML